MKSVGEAMAIGRTFPESLQKALRSLETGLTGLDEIEIEGLGKGDDRNAIKAAIGTPTPDRLLKVAQALRLGVSHDEVYDSCKIDRWFLEQLQDIVDMEAKVKAHGLPQTPGAFRQLKAHGLLRCPPRGAHPHDRGRGARAAPLARRAPGLQAHRHLRGRVRLADRLHVLDLYGALRRQARRRGRSVGRQEGHHPRRRPEPDRPGHRVRLLLLPCLLRAEGRGLRDHHDQLQPGDGLDRLRHLRPALFRAADRRRTCWRSSRPSAPRARCTASSCSSAARRR